MQTPRILTAGLAVALTGAMGVSLAAQQTESPALAKQLVAALGEKKLDCVFAKDPSTPGQYVAALHVAGLQLIVVSAQFADPANMEFRMFSADCMGAYVDMNAAVTAKNRLIINDIGADGLVANPKKNAPRDGVTRGADEIKLDGDSKALKAAKMTPEEFQKTFDEIESTYSGYLKLLIARLKG